MFGTGSTQKQSERHVLKYAVCGLAFPLLVFPLDRIGLSHSISAPTLPFSVVIITLGLLWPLATDRRKLDPLGEDILTFIDSYRRDLKIYERQLKSAERATGDETIWKRNFRVQDDIYAAKQDLNLAEELVKKGRYADALNIYYEANRKVIDIAAHLDNADEVLKEAGVAVADRNRLRELADFYDSHADDTPGKSIKRRVHSLLRDGDSVKSDPAVSDVQTSATLINSLHVANLRKAMGVKRIYDPITVYLGIVDVAFFLIPMAVVVPCGPRTLLPWLCTWIGSLGISIADSLLLLASVPLGIVGSIVSVAYTWGAFDLELDLGPDLPSEFLVDRIMQARILWGGFAAPLVQLFVRWLDITGGSPEFLLLVAFAAGFTDRFLLRAVTQVEEKL